MRAGLRDPMWCFTQRHCNCCRGSWRSRCNYHCFWRRRKFITLSSGIMKRLIALFTVLFFACSSPLTASSNTFLDYQNYNHGYCPDCNCSPCKCGACESSDPAAPSTCAKPNPCAPPATTCATECGISLWCIGIGLAALITAAVLIVGSNNGHNHSAP